MNITRVAAVIAGLGAIAAFFLGWIDGTTALQTIFGALSVFGITKKIEAQQVGGKSAW